MDPAYLEAIKKALAKSGTDTGDLERAAELAQHSLGEDSKAVAKFTMPPRDMGGVNVHCLVLDVKKPKTKTDYTLIVWRDFAKTTVPQDAGRKIDMHHIDLNIEKDVKMTVQEKEAHDRENANVKGANKRIYKKTHGGTIQLHTGSIIKLSTFENTHYSIAGRDVRAGDIVLVRSLIPQIRFQTPDATVSKYGLQWWIPEPDKGGMQADDQSSYSDVVNSLASIVPFNEILNVGTNGCLSEANEDAYEQLRHKEIGASSASWDKEEIITGMTPRDKRHILNKALILPFERQDITPEGAAGNQFVVLGAPQWDSTFVVETGERDAKVAVCIAKCVYEAKTYDDEGVPITAKIQLHVRKEHTGRFGIINTLTWAKLAPVLMRHAKGVVAAHLWTANSAALPECQLDTNERSEDGTYPMGYAFACYYVSDFVHVNLPATLLSAGFEITADCAAKIVEHKYKTTDFLRTLPEDVKHCVEDSANYLRTLDDKPVINLFESRNRFDDLREDYVFVLLVKKDKNHKDVVDIVDELKSEAEQEGVDWIELQDQLILGTREVRGWPVSIKDKKLVYTVFAIRKDLADEARRPSKQISPDEFAERYTAALEKRKQRELVQSELAALRGMDADELFADPQVLNNPGSPGPANPGSPGPVNPSSPEQKPKRRKTRAKK